ncbi:MAG: hypothetical protein JWN02_2790 [Acidobacteria bacterium]|nr:hypothetical protein [Acidobacteriota bacterium]
MAGAIGLFDLSIVTDRLIELVKTYRDRSPIFPLSGDPLVASPTFTIDITGAAPDAARSGNGGACVMSVYLFHVAPDKHQRNAPLPLRPPVSLPAHASVRVPAIPFHPLALDLYYLVTAWAPGNNYVQEQQAMSIALKAFYENPILKSDAGREIEELTLTMELETADDLGRLWQAVTTSARLAAVYKVSAVFMTPDRLGAPALPMTAMQVAVGARGPSSPPPPASPPTAPLVVPPASGGTP